MIDYRHSIDLNAFGADIACKIDAENRIAEPFKSIVSELNTPGWTFQIDYLALCAVVYYLMFNEPLSVTKNLEGRWAIIIDEMEYELVFSVSFCEMDELTVLRFSFIQAELWTKFFDCCLNGSPATLNAHELRKPFEEYLQGNVAQRRMIKRALTEQSSFI